ncbi:MGMT family protein [Comamonas aquatilis]|uniref:methylated-DNA--[protein]-cysteine S-methyltransferase n=1 Tax=Comamonas aquatilis TaxID=1778406 RepID=UPI0039F00315
MTDALAPMSQAHALFATRIGVCGLAWNQAALVAVQLPELELAQTRERMLRGLEKRHGQQPSHAHAAYPMAAAVAELPGWVCEAIGGMQQLLAGVLPSADWDDSVQAAARLQGVIGDLRAIWLKSQTPHQTLPDLRNLPLDEFGVSDFHRRVYAFTRALAPGQTCTYGDVARALGDMGLARAVGQALGANPFAPVVPCHRVLAAGRQPGGFSGGQGAITKLRMLELEGGAWGGTRSLFE